MRRLDSHRAEPSASSAAERESSRASCLEGNVGEQEQVMRADSHRHLYVDAVIDHYVSLPGTPVRAGRQDRRLASSLYEQAVPLAAVHAALVLGTARRTLRSSHLCPLPPIRTLHYFLPVIEEVLHCPLEPGYVDYLAQKLRPWSDAKRAARRHVGTLASSNRTASWIRRS